jgi:plastocyanin
MITRGRSLVRNGFSLAILGLTLVAGLLMLPPAASAQQTWYVQVGAESHSEAKQATAFLPNEIWIYAGDSITFKFAPKNEVHTVTFLDPGDPSVMPAVPAQVRPFFAPGPPGAPVGCDHVDSETATQPSGSSYGGHDAMAPNYACVNSGPMADGATYTVTFPTPGNYKMVCLVHADMNGVVHVLQNTDSSAPFYATSLPYDQFDYNRQARDEARDLLTDNDTPREERADFPPSANVVLMTGEVSATPGGRQYVAIVRFLPGTIQIHAGETVEWINADPTEPHTVTFGAEPLHGPTQVLHATPGPDGALEATITSPSETGNSNVSSGFLQAALQDRTGLAQSAPGVTRLRITFPNPGVYVYKCALHDVDGMVGKVVVLP